jgi:hypothetical protein
LSKNYTKISSENHPVGNRLQEALDKLEIAIEKKMLTSEKVVEPSSSPFTSKRTTTELQEKNKIALSRLDGAINQIRKILGS